MVTRYLKKIGVFSLGKILGAIYAVMGLIFGAIMTLLSFGTGSMMGNEGAAAGMAFGVGSIIIFPIIYAIMGFIGGIITAVIFNAVAGFTGGLEIEVE